MGTFYEFFAGGGMAHAGLGLDWRCLFANDFDIKKTASYQANWPGTPLNVGDIKQVQLSQLERGVDLAWASFPCQDLSLAGAGAGLKGDRSGTFWPFWSLMKGLAEEGDAPRMVILENVCGALSSHDGKDFSAIGSALVGADYRFGALVIDAAHFLPQSRPRLFIIGIHKSLAVPKELIQTAPTGPWHPTALIDAYSKMPKRSRDAWLWWKLPVPHQRQSIFADLVEDKPIGVRWHSKAETANLLGMMNELHRSKIKEAQASGKRRVGTIYKRTRLVGGTGEKIQRAEVRFDNIAGCLRTPSGGSSRQTIIVIEGKNVRSRLLSPREAARLMGLSDDYILPERYNDAYHLAGDGVAVPVVRFLAENLVEKVLFPVQELAAA